MVIDRIHHIEECQVECCMERQNLDTHLQTCHESDCMVAQAIIQYITAHPNSRLHQRYASVLNNVQSASSLSDSSASIAASTDSIASSALSNAHSRKKKFSEPESKSSENY